MPATQSNLTDYGYDLIVATTQAAINATMKQFLAGIDSKVIEICYRPTPGANAPSTYEPVTPDQYPAFLKSANASPFDPPDGSDAQNALVKQMYNEAQFDFGFRCKLGLPDVADLNNIPDIIRMDKGSKIVTYNLFFAEFAIFTIAEKRSVLRYSKISQPGDRPWTFSFTVNLGFQNLGTDGISVLPADVQNKIRKLFGASGFGVQQLYLDLANKAISAQPSIPLDPNSAAAPFLTTVFMDIYWKSLTKDGPVVLGTTVTPDSTTAVNNASLIPTVVTTEISPNLDAKGAETGNYPLYTLSYQAMSENRRLPGARRFTWNWVEESEAATAHGVMVIRRAVFADFLGRLLTPELQKLCLLPSASVCANLTTFKVDYSLAAAPADKLTKFQTVTEKASSGAYSSQVLKFNYNEISIASEQKMGNCGVFRVRNIVDSCVYFESNMIRIDTTFTIFLSLQAQEVTSEGNAYKSVVSTTYQITVDPAGNLVCTVDQSKSTSTDKSEELDQSLYISYLSKGGINEIVAQAKSESGVYDSMLQGYSSDITNLINSAQGWVFPANKTFFFKRAQFSDNQDLIAYITYADPTSA